MNVRLTVLATNSYLHTILPLIGVALSLIFLTLQLILRARESQLYRAYKLVNPLHPHPWDFRIPINNATSEDDDDEDTDSETEADRNEELAIRTVLTRTEASVMTVDRPRGELVLPLIEELAVLAVVGINAGALITGAWGHSSVAEISSLVVWSYIALLTSLRLIFSASSQPTFPALWSHTAFLYSYQWLLTVLLFRSVIIHPRSSLAQGLMSANFALTTLLTLIALTSRRGNKAVELEYEGDLEPSREPLASLLSIATFSWVDPIVWKGYKKTYEMSDVWNLFPKDKAEAVLADYRQLKKTTILAFHLLKYFKRGFIIQASWAALSGLNLFVPTLLLKAILEYVERPEDTPANAAWFYVILLFVSGVVSALSGGQALWVGRKICIRLRAIIIGEIYAKALRRRAAAAADKILGQEEKKSDEDENNRKPGVMQKFKTLVRGKKGSERPKPDAKKPADPAEQVSSGAIINLMAVDSFKVSEISAYLHFLWAETPVQVVLAVYLLYSILGFSSIAGIIIMILLLPVNLTISKQFARMQKLILAATDARIHTTNEVLTNIRIIKYFSWEDRFLGLVDEKRRAELKNLRNRYIIWALAATIWGGAPMIITAFTFLVYTLVEKKDLVPSVAFTALSLFSLLRIPLDQLADMVAHVQESKVSVDRVEEYLNEPETDKYHQLQTDEVDDDGNPVMGFDDATFSWGSEDTEDFKMIDLNLRFDVGQLNVIVGPTGSGKTSLLMALLGEMTKIKGDVYLPGARSREDMKPDPQTGLTESVAYCAQQAWLVNGTIKENILFASPFDAKRYKNVIVACSLQRDLEILDAGDQTLVGEKGVTLSGGQKQRISLARALYCNARHVLLDDVLSAVDSHTSKWIFDKALMGPLMYNRTCILVTHNTSLCLPHAHFAVVLDNGRVTTQGTAREVISSGRLGEDLSKSLPASRGASTIPSRVPSDVGGEEAFGEHHTHANGNGHANGAANGDADGEPLTKVISTEIPGMNKNVDATVPGETKATGSVNFSIIIMYLKSMGRWYYWTLAAVIFAAQQIAQVATNVWIREWANAYSPRKEMSTMDIHQPSPLTHIHSGIGSPVSCLRTGSCLMALPFFGSSNDTMQIQRTDGHNEVDAKYYLAIYACLAVAFMVITALREGVLFGGSLVASGHIHRRLMEAVMHAKFRFFDSTPLGQLMNRFSKDIELVDQEIAPVAVGVVHCMASIITIVILISVITPAFLIAGVFITIMYFLIGMFYINSSRDLKRLESVQRSPLYQQFGETLSGMTTIRAYGDERRFIRENMHKVNTHSRPFIYLWGANRWLAFRVDVTGALVSFFAGAFVILSVGKIDAGAAGLAMTYAVTFTENVLWFVRLYSVNEQNMNAVERIKEYYDVDQEADYIIPENRPAANWPSKGGVEFVGYSTRYRDDFDFVLKNISFKIMPGEKVGVVGRTGAGKSSLALALFRALEAEEGKILIDDVDVGLIGLQDLRENIVMVPQGKSVV